MHTRYFAAEQLAHALTVEAGDNLESLTLRWTETFAARTGLSLAPTDEQVAAARHVLAQKLAFAEPPALPPSASSNAWRLLPELLSGVPATTD